MFIEYEFDLNPIYVEALPSRFRMTPSEQMDVALHHLDELVKMIRNDLKRKKYLLGNYQSRLATITEILDGSRE